MIPDTPEFNHALGSLAVGELSSFQTTEKCTVCEPVIYKQPSGTLQKSEALDVGFHRTSKISLDALIRKVQLELSNKGHTLCDPTSSEANGITKKLLAMAVALSREPDEVRANLNTILAEVTDSNVGLFAIVDVPAMEAEVYRFGDFNYGRLNSERFEHLCKHAGSDYFEREGRFLQNRLAVWRELLRVPTFSFSGSSLSNSQLESRQEKLLKRLIDDYYGQIAEGLFGRFRAEMSTEQAVTCAAGVGEITSEFIWQFSSIARLVAVFTRSEADRGWVVPTQLAPHIVTVSPKSLSVYKSQIVDDLRLYDLGQRGLDPSIQRFCEYLQASEEHRRQGRVEEALIHSIFAIDLLLGGKAGDALTVVLSERASWLAHGAIGAEISKLTKFIRESYDLRSGYAHRGERGDHVRDVKLAARLDDISDVTKVILAAACWARLQAWCSDRDTWLARIDLLRAQHAACASIEETLAQLGLNRIQRRSDGIGFILDWVESPSSGIKK